MKKTQSIADEKRLLTTVSMDDIKRYGSTFKSQLEAFYSKTLPSKEAVDVELKETVARPFFQTKKS